MQWPDPRTALGAATWPQWDGWQHCAVTGDLIDPDGNTYGPESIRAAAWLLALQDNRERMMWADVGGPRRAFEISDVATSPRGMSRRCRSAGHGSRRNAPHAPRRRSRGRQLPPDQR